MLVTFVEVATVSILVSFYSAKPQAADHPLLLNPVRPKRQKPAKPARPVKTADSGNLAALASIADSSSASGSVN
jgi:hypothetical protein